MAFTNFNPILDEIDQAHATLSPPAQQAIALAHQGIGRGIPQGPQVSSPDPSGGIGLGPTPTVDPGQAAPVSAPRPIATPSAVRGLGPAPAPQDPAQTARVGEFNRLTAAPLSGPLAHTSADTGQSGIGQVHNPWARGALHVADALGSTFLPGLTQAIPGTELHHQALVRHAASNINQDETQKTAVAGRAHQAAEDTHLAAEDVGTAAHARHESAQTDALLNPKEKPTNEWSELKDLVTDPEHPEIGPQAAFFNKNDPKQGLVYGKAPAAAKPKEESQNVHVLPDGSVVAVHHDPNTGKSSAEVVYKGDPKVETEITKVMKGGKSHNVLVKKGTGEEIKDLGESGEKPSTQDYGTNVVDPSTNTIVRVKPGQQMPGGATTTTQFGAANAPTSASRGVADQAKGIRMAGDNLIKEIDAKKGKLGNLGSYWDQAVNQTPIADADISGLMTSLSSFAALQPKLHGFRSHEAMREFAKIIGGVPKNPEALKASIRSIQNTAEIMERMGKIQVPGEQPAPAGAPAGPPNVTTKEQFDALPKGAVYMEDGKQYRKP